MFRRCRFVFRQQYVNSGVWTTSGSRWDLADGPISDRGEFRGGDDGSGGGGGGGGSPAVTCSVVRSSTEFRNTFTYGIRNNNK